MGLKFTARCVVAFLNDERGYSELVTGDKKELSLGSATQNIRGGKDDLPNIESAIQEEQLPHPTNNDLEKSENIPVDEDKEYEEYEERADEGDELIVGSKSDINNQNKENNYHER